MSKKLIDRKVEYLVVPFTWDDKEHEDLHEWCNTFKECKDFLNMIYLMNDQFKGIKIREYIIRDYADSSRDINSSGFEHTLTVEDIVYKVS